MTKEQKVIYMREWRKKNREHVYAYLKEWRKKNRDLYLAQKRRHNERKKLQREAKKAASG